MPREDQTDAAQGLEYFAYRKRPLLPGLVQYQGKQPTCYAQDLSIVFGQPTR